MKKVMSFAASAALLASTSAFAHGFYVQGGGGVGFTQGGIDKASTYILSSTASTTHTPFAAQKTKASGAWDIGVGYQITDLFGVEVNYIDYAETTDEYTRNVYIAAYTEHTWKMTTDVWQVNVVGTGRIPLHVGTDFDVKAKAGVGYVSQEQTVRQTIGSSALTYVTPHDQSEYKMSPVLGIGLEKRFSDMFSLNVEYTAATQTQVANNVVAANVVFHLSDMMGMNHGKSKSKSKH